MRGRFGAQRGGLRRSPRFRSHRPRPSAKSSCRKADPVAKGPIRCDAAKPGSGCQPGVETAKPLSLLPNDGSSSRVAPTKMSVVSAQQAVPCRPESPTWDSRNPSLVAASCCTSVASPQTRRREIRRAELGRTASEIGGGPRPTFRPSPKCLRAKIMLAEAEVAAARRRRSRARWKHSLSLKFVRPSMARSSRSEQSPANWSSHRQIIDIGNVRCSEDRRRSR